MPVDLFPVLKYLPAWLPGMAFKRHALSVREDVQQMRTLLFEGAKEKMKMGASNFLIASLFESLSRDGQISVDDELDIMSVAAVLYGASTDTTSSVMETFLLAMVHYPDVYRKAQDEVDRIVGRDRLPDLTDRDSLPYVEAVIMESYRWHPPFPLGVPHVTTKSDYYQGYHIPKGALVIGNVWAITRNPAVYDDPETFCPERFIDQKQLDPRDMVFGFGRRICPGKVFGDTNLWLAAVSILAAFDIAVPGPGPLSLGGKLNPPAFTSGFITHPEPFECVFKPRSAKTLDLISQTLAAREW